MDNIKYYEVTKENPIIMKLETSKEKFLYHYTNNDGVRGILKNNSLWVTNSNFLDDKTEIKYISTVLHGVIIYLIKSKKLYDLGIKGQFYIYDGIIKTLESLMETYKNNESPIRGGNLFILSLSENGKNKYLSKNYCGKNGAILKFKNDINSTFKQNKHIILKFSAKVVYDFGKQMTLIIEDINEFYYEFLYNLIKEKSVNYMDVVKTIKSVIILKIINYSFFFKRMDYSKEEEYRIVFLLSEDYNNKFLNYRIKSNKEIPYIKVDFEKGNLAGVRFIEN